MNAADYYNRRIMAQMMRVLIDSDVTYRDGTYILNKERKKMIAANEKELKRVCRTS